MKVVGISGSPNQKGFTSLLLDKAMEGARSSGADTEKIILNELEFDPCQECGGCYDNGECVLKDDLRPVYKKILSADALVVASPVYFGTISAQLKMMIDRLECLWVAKHILKKSPARRQSKKGIFICVSGDNRKEHFEASRRSVKAMFVTIGVKYSGELFAGDIDKLVPDSAKGKKAVERAFKLGASLFKK